ncbi:MAG: hypothetical protein ACOC7R_03640 [Planctomycetota bacterium]
MGKSKKRKKKKDRKKASRPKRSMTPGRVSAVERIERAEREAAQTGPRAAPAAPTNPAAAGRIAEARRLGLSVADDASADKVDDLLERFALALAYTRDVWARMAPSAEAPPGRRMHRATASLFEDGRLADQVVAAQRRRASDPDAPPPHGPTRKAVATALRREFDDLLPARSLLGRLLGH